MNPKQPDKKTAVCFLTIDESHVGQRIDNFLMAQLRRVPRSLIYRILRKGEVRVNKKRVKPIYRLQQGDEVRIPPVQIDVTPQLTKPSQQAMHCLAERILYEDANLLVINKPFGMAVHGGSGLSYGMIEALRELRPRERHLELVHRLDKETSGCLLIAKKPSVLKELHALLRLTKVEKTYLALVKGYWGKTVKRVEVALQKNQLRSGERIVTVTPEGKESVTHFRVIQYCAQATLIEAKPQTGRTHQIRVHTSYLGHPIAGDSKYGDKEFNKQMRKYGCKRLFLHAAAIAFVLPQTGQSIVVEASLEPDLALCLQKLNELAST